MVLVEVGTDSESAEIWSNRQPADEEVHAATILQAGFKGSMVREILNASKPGKHTTYVACISSSFNLIYDMNTNNTQFGLRCSTSLFVYSAHDLASESIYHVQKMLSASCLIGIFNQDTLLLIIVLSFRAEA